ncbi:MAG: ATP-dependent helicase [Sedimentisphaerales bacterium]|nr:ATP-dependent helicase [Sedimentisphaerales bacterium]
MPINLAELNANQRAAVEWSGGPLLILAGPGSGKTRVLTMRIAKLIEDSPAERFRILGLTFTTKAAAEMRQRIDAMVSKDRERALLSTFHSYCAGVLRQHGSHIGLHPDFTILNQEADRQAVLLDVIRVVQRNDGNAEDTDTRLMPLVDQLLDHGVSNTDVESCFHDKELGRKVAPIYAAYRSLLISQNRLDFASLLNCVVELLQARPQIAQHIRTIYRHVCVDEFQDTNHAQYRVLTALVGSEPRDLFVVADDDQIIYQWNGASPERLKQLTVEYKMAVIQLPANYRCPPQVIDIANNLIRNNGNRSADKQPLTAIKTAIGQQTIRVQDFPSVDDELVWVAKDVRGRPEAKRGDCVILARTRKLLERAVAILIENGVPASLVMRKEEFVSAPFRWLHAILRLANARGDKEQVRRLCKAFYELEGLDIAVQDVLAVASAIGGDNLRAWFDTVLGNARLEPSTQAFLTKARKQLADRLEFLPFIAEASAWFDGVDQRLAGQAMEGFVDYKEERAIWQDLQGRVMREYGSENTDLTMLLQEFDLSPKAPPVPPNAVRCLTIHGSKGMEFGNVYLIGLAEEQLPSFQSIRKGDSSREMQEERRNCFVAITRAQTSLTLTYAHSYFGWPKQPSRFLYEMGLLH